MNKIVKKLTVMSVLLSLLGGAVAAQGDELEKVGLAQTKTQESLPPLEEQTIAEDTSLKALGMVQAYMDTVKSLEAKFIQRAPDGSVTEGKLSMARPGRVRFDYTDDVPFLVVADGKTVNFIDYEIGQVTRWPVKDTPLRALLGNSTDLSSVGANIEQAPGGLEGLVALHANDPDKPELGHITVYFEETPVGAEAPLRLLSWAVTDAQGQITTVELSGGEVNVELDDDLWQFDDPRGLAKRRRAR